jgi:hypothetical protein
MPWPKHLHLLAQSLRPDRNSSSLMARAVDQVGRIAPYSVKVLRHGTLPPSLLRKTCAAPLTDRPVAVRRAASFGFASDASPDKAKIGRSRVGAARFFNA